MDLRNQLETALGTGFHIIRELGGGGMSRVFLAEDIEHDRQIVVKVIPEELAGQVSIERFRREIKVAARLQHPCIVPVLGSGSANGLPYYTMPFVEGESLRSRLSREKGLAVPEALRILRDVAGALAYAHEHGVLHRDIKPDNVLVTRHHAVLVDFGVAKALTDSTQVGPALTSVGIALGTPAYMAPEQATADASLDHRADIYSLGVVAYEMLAGRHPFEGRSSQSMLAAHAIESPLGVTVHRPQLPGPIASLVTRMLEKHPADRPQSAEEVLSALNQIETPTAHATYSPEAQSPGSYAAIRRKRLILLSGGVGALVTLVALSLIAFRASSRDNVRLSPASVLVLAPDGGPALIRESERVRDVLMQGISRVPHASLANHQEDNFDIRLSPAEAGKGEGAGTVVTGKLYPVGDSLGVQFKVVDATTDRVVHTFDAARIPRNPEEADLRRAIDPVLSVIGFVSEPALGAVAIPIAIPSFAAFGYFQSAIQLAPQNDTASTRQTLQLFQRAFEADTSFIAAKLWLAWALRSSGQIRAASGAAEKFDSISVFVSQRRFRLTSFEQLVADMTAQRTASDREVALLRQVIALAPRTPFRASLPNMLLDLNRPYSADSAYDDLLRSDSSLTSQPRFWLGRAALYHYVGNYKKSFEAASRARKLAPSDISAFRPALTALAAMGDTAAFRRLLDEAQIASPNGTFFGFAGDLYLEAGQELIAHGQPELGARTLKLAADWFDARTPKQLASTTIGLRAALAYVNENRLDDAERILKPLVSPIDPEVRFLGLLGRIAAIRGDTVSALRYSQQLADLPAEKLSGVSTFERAQIAAELNQRAEAVSFLRDAFSQGVVFNYRARMHWFLNFMRMKDYPAFKALITPQG